MRSNCSSHLRVTPSDGADVLADLVRARTGGDASRCQRAEAAVVVRFLSVASTVAHRFLRRGVEFDDLEQVARLGLVKAVRRWRVDRGAFLPYALPTVEGEVKRYFRDSGSTIRIPRSMYEAQPRVTAAVRELCQESASDPAVPDIARRAGIPEQQVRQVRAAASACRPSPTDGSDAIDQVSSSSAERDLSVVDIRIRLRPALATLPARERQVVVLRFVWDQSQVQIAASLGISQMQVSRLLRAALDRLRERVGVWDGPSCRAGSADV